MYTSEAYECVDCRVSYPIVLGIPDFRIAPDPWIGLEEDRAKGLELERTTKGMTCDAMVRAYWDMTPETPRAMVERFVAHVLHAEQRSREWIASQVGGQVGVQVGVQVGDDAGAHTVDTSRQGREQWLDIGCGTADFAAAAGPRSDVTSIDVAFRWLVVARRRLLQHGLPLRLVCCNAEALPFSNAVFQRAWSSGTIEHVTDQRAMLRETNRTLSDGGVLHMRTVNRFSLLPEPHVGLLGVGWLPRRLADRWVHWRTGQTYLHHRLLSAHELRNMLRDAGFLSIHVGAAQALPSDYARLSGRALKRLLPLYEFARHTSVLSSITTTVSPLIEATAMRT